MKVDILSFFFLVSALAHASCSANNPLSPSAQAAVRGTEWSLVALNGAAVAPTGRKPTLLLADNDRASGFAGCNQFSGSYALASESLRFSAMAMTRMYCADTADLEQRYVSALEATRAYRVTGARLELLDNQSVIAAFEKR